MVSTAAILDGDLQLTVGLRAEDATRLLQALDYVHPLYVGRTVPTGQDALAFSRGVVVCLAALASADTLTDPRIMDCTLKSTE